MRIIMYKFLVTFSYGHLDLHGFCTLSEEDWKQLQTDMSRYDFTDRYELYWGNHFLSFHSVEDLASCFRAKLIGEGEEESIIRLFGSDQWGLDPQMFLENY